MKKILILLSAFTPLLPITLTLRPARSTDISALYEFDKNVSEEYFLPLLKQCADPFLANVTDEIIEEWVQDDIKNFQKAISGTDNMHLYIACIHTHIIGFILFSKIDTHASIDLILMHKKARGKGIGSKLMSLAMTYFDDVTDCTLIVLANNAQAIAFYESAGFVPLNSIPEYYPKFYREHPNLYVCYSKPL